MLIGWSTGSLYDKLSNQGELLRTNNSDNMLFDFKA